LNIPIEIQVVIITNTFLQQDLMVRDIPVKHWLHWWLGEKGLGAQKGPMIQRDTMTHSLKVGHWLNYVLQL